jgi:arsenate reductase-like glutaredoxin family protein
MKLNEWQIELFISTPYSTNCKKAIQWLETHNIKEILQYLNDPRFFFGWTVSEGELNSFFTKLHSLDNKQTNQLNTILLKCHEKNEKVKEDLWD